MLADHFDVRSATRILSFAKKEFAEVSVERFLGSLFHWSTDIVLPLETGEIYL